jgi:hypothetical protein
LMKRGDEKCFGDQVTIKSCDKHVSAATWLMKRGDEKCFGDQVVLRRDDNKSLATPVQYQRRLECSSNQR